MPEHSDGASRQQSRASRRGLQQQVRDALEALGDRDREISILLGIEQISNQAVAAQLGIQPSTVTTRFKRALARPRQLLPGSVFAELDEGA